MAKDSKEDVDLSYVCVHCGEPCASLYYQLSASLSSIKALSCAKCGEIVDPYIEREWLLVVIDCILMRLEAYRHVLWNADETKGFRPRKLLQLLMAWSILDAYLKWETQRTEIADEANPEVFRTTVFVLSLMLSSFLGMLAEWFVIYLFLVNRKQGGANKRENNQSSVAYKIFLALLLPSTFAVITIIVMMWENTKTVRLLGSIMTAYWKALAISAVSVDWKAPVIGIIARAIWQIFISTFEDIPCVGLEAKLGFCSLDLCLT